jgi:hypothetical protein
MAEKKLNLLRSTIARGKAAVKEHRVAKKKKARAQPKDNPKQIELAPKLNLILDTLSSQSDG